MIYLLYGEDRYRKNAFLKSLKSDLNIDDNSMNLTTHKDNFDMDKIALQAKSVPFLSDKRIIILEGALKNKDKNFLDKLTDWVGSAPDYCEIIFIEDSSPDKRLRITKIIEKVGKIHEFRPMIPGEVIVYIKNRVKLMGGLIDDKATRELQFACGTNLNSVNNEIDKLISYNINITSENIDLLVDAGYFNRIFDLTDAISDRNPKKALYHLDKLISIGEEPLGILAMISGQVRNLILVWDLKEHGLSECEIQSRSKLHQFVVKKSLSQLHHFNKTKLLQMHQNILETDKLIKQGSNEPKALLERLVINISKKEA